MKKLIFSSAFFLMLCSVSFAQIPFPGPAIPKAQGANGVIGTTAHEYTSLTVYGIHGVVHSKFQPTTAGTVRYGHVYQTAGSTEDIHVCIYNSSGVKLLCCSGNGGSGGNAWFNCDSGSTTVLTAATNYYLGIQTDDAGTETIYVGRTESSATGIWKESTYGTVEGNLNTAEETQVTSGEWITILWNNVSGNPP
jgi:hypothetical protein